MNWEKLLSHIYGNGLFHIFTTLMCSLTCFFAVVEVQMLIFMHYEPKFTCNDQRLVNASKVDWITYDDYHAAYTNKKSVTIATYFDNFTNKSVTALRKTTMNPTTENLLGLTRSAPLAADATIDTPTGNATLVGRNDNDKIKECWASVLWSNSTQTQAFSCQSWKFDSSIMKRTLITDFQLICANSAWPARLEMTAITSMALGAGLALFADCFGRRRIFLTCVVLEMVTLVLIPFSPNVEAMLAIRIIRGLASSAINLGICVVCEVLPAKKRSIYYNMYWQAWSLGYILTPGLVYTLRSWFMPRIILLSPLLVYPAFYFVLPESPRWLVLQGRTKEAFEVLQNIARWNGVKLSSLENSPITDEAIVQLQKNWSQTTMIELDEADNCKDSTYLTRNLTNESMYISDTSRQEKYESEISSNERTIYALTNYLELSGNQICSSKTTDLDASTSKKDSFMYDPVKQTTATKSPTLVKTEQINCMRIETARFKELCEVNAAKSSAESFVASSRACRLCVCVAINALIQSAIALSYTGLSTSGKFTSENIFLNVFYQGLVETPSSVLAWFFSERLGRRNSLNLLLGVTAGVLFTIHFTGGRLTSWLHVIIAVLGKTSLTAAYCVSDLYMSELFPTSLRSRLFHTVVIIAGIIAAIAPYVNRLSAETVSPNNTSPSISIYAGTLATSTLLAYIFLPETKNQPMPESIADSEAIIRRHETASLLRLHWLIQKSCACIIGKATRKEEASSMPRSKVELTHTRSSELIIESEDQF